VKRIIGLLAVLALVGIVAGCGETKQRAVTAGPSSSTTKHESAEQEVKELFLNMENLAESVKEKINEQKKGAGETLAHEQCVKTGKLTAECHGEYAGGRQESLKVRIAEEGQWWESY
jgi:hypothetical protein